MEQILASHSSVEGTMELAHLGLIAKSLKGFPLEGLPAKAAPLQYPDTLAGLPAEQFGALGEKFMADPRMKSDEPMPFDGKRMIYGGFATLFDTQETA